MIKGKMRTTPKPFLFVLMPFSKEFDDVYKLGIQGAAVDADVLCERVDEQLFHEGIMEKVFSEIARANLIIADMTGRNANVFYEVGYAHALGKKVLLLTQSIEDIPFDLKNRPHVVYQSIHHLRNQLKERIVWALNNDIEDDAYERAFQQYLSRIKGVSSGMHRFLSPIAMRHFDNWYQEVADLTSKGSPLQSHERLEITKAILRTAESCVIIERFVGDPEKLHTKNWLAFFEEFSSHWPGERQWIICVTMEQVMNNLSNLKLTTTYIKKWGFTPFLCDSEEVESVLKRKLPNFDVIEYYDDVTKYVKLHGPLYISGTAHLQTIFRVTSAFDKSLVAMLTQYSEEISEELLTRLRQKRRAFKSKRRP